jgi:hypothetical protein
LHGGSDSCLEESVAPAHPGSVVAGDGWSAHESSHNGCRVVISRNGAVRASYRRDPVPGVIDVCIDDKQLASRSGNSPPVRVIGAVEVLPMALVMLLAGRCGVLIHSAGLVYRQRGALWTGVSGSGKSTLSRLWREAKLPDCRIIDDEHIILRDVGGEPRLYGAPWTKGGRESDEGNVPVEHLFFLVHGQKNEVIPLSPGQAVARLMSQVFLPLWSPKQLELVVTTCDSLVQGVKSYELSFLPAADTVPFLRRVLEEG